MIILGIDPSLNSCGYCILSEVNSVIKIYEVGSIKSKKNDTFFEKLSRIKEKFEQISDQYKSLKVIIEETFVNTNYQSSLKLGVVRGVCLSCFLKQEIKEYSPRFIKKSITGSGTSDKIAMTKMINMLIPENNAKNDDEIDSIAIAICGYLDCRK